ncbi:MAG: LLM class flavin-dependent oxidoreductase [Actinobacteria bacterium]|nr:LLM class flavin-dependent oxidoreductase [Actinomycetota bacterium]
MALVVMRFDMRRPPISPMSAAELYGTTLEMSRWADQNGLASLVVSEHHGVDDGYVSSPMVMASAMAGATKNIMINIAAVIAPLHDPLRLAEDIAILDLASGGRLSLVLGLGYRPDEYAMFDKDWKGRGKAFDEMLGVLKQAWTGEPFEYQGRTVRVTPPPLSQPHPLIFIGGSSPNAAKRAAKHAMSFFPALGDPALQQAYMDECARLGTSPGMVLLPSGPGFLHVAEDPDKAWVEIGEYILYETRVYASWQLPGQTSHVHSHATTVDELRAEGNYLIVTPEEAVKVANDLGPMGSLVLHPLIGGMPPEQAWSSLELIGTQVMPKLT